MYRGVFVAVLCISLLLFPFVKHESLAACDPPVRIVGDAYTPASIQDAYDYANQTLNLTDFTLQLSGDIFTENLFFDKGATVLLDGGYDCTYSIKTSTTGIYGFLNVSSGAVNFAGDIAIVSTDICEFDSDLDSFSRFSQIGTCTGIDADCNDQNVNINPAAVEICDGLDNDCNGLVDDGFTPTDADGDGYFGSDSCGSVAEDCNDSLASINPSALDIPYDGIDQDCNGVDLTFAEENYCSNCHGPAADWIFEHTLTTAPDGTCATCHAAHVINILPSHYGDTVRTAGNNMAAGSKIVCNSCHDQQTIEHNFGANIVSAKIYADYPNLTCDTCHEDRALAHATATAHDNRIIIAECGYCHTSDPSNLGSPGTGTLVNNADVDSLHNSDCSLCHNYSGTKLNTSTVRQAIQLGLKGAQIGCNDCHDLAVNHHGSGSSGNGCIECHGHDVGTLIDTDMQAPYTAGVIASQGKGSYKSHSTHTERTGADARGPGIYCDTCHDINNFPILKDGHNLANTTVCNPCHSPDGMVDGVNHETLGAKNNWSSGVYYGEILPEAKQLWCITCHDGGSANSMADGSGINAPDVAGDGTTYGFYINGHGRNNQVACSNCHDVTSSHIDHQYTPLATVIESTPNPTNYRLYDGRGITLPYNDEPTTDSFALCYTCHEESWISDGTTIGPDLDTNFRLDDYANMPNGRGEGNLHYYHIYTTRFKATCVKCHNPHGPPTGSPVMTDPNESGNFRLLTQNGNLLYELTDPNDWHDPAKNVGGAITAIPACGGCHTSYTQGLSDGIPVVDGYGNSLYLRTYKPPTFNIMNDQDNDTILDILDNCTETANTDQADLDGDGIGDACDNCVATPNEEQTDADNDGIGDLCDNCVDIDADGLCSDVDNCDLIANPNQIDSDADLVGDACDNCPTMFNPDQQDLDNDGIGDSCDICPNYADNSPPDWIIQTGTSSDDRYVAMDSDAAGNIYLAGFSAGDFAAPRMGYGDIIVSKYSPGGTHLWSRQLGTDNNDQVRDIAVDAAGNSYTIGYTYGQLGDQSFGNIDMFVVKYDSDGNQQWIKQIGTHFYEYGQAVSIATDGNILITGSTGGSLASTNSGDDDTYVAKYDTDGILLWHVQLPGASPSTYSSALNQVSSGAIFLARGDILYRLDATGSVVWQQTVGHFGRQPLVIDTDGNLLVTGYTNDSLFGENQGSTDFFLAKYDADGNLLWGKQFGTSVTDRANAVAIDSNANIYLAGSTYYDTAGQIGAADIFFQKRTPDGNLIWWTKQLGSIHNDFANDLLIDASSNLFVTGSTFSLFGTAAFGREDMFLFRMPVGGCP